VLDWATVTYRHLAGLAAGTEAGEAGVRLAPLRIVARQPLDVPAWVAVAGGAGPLPDDVPEWATHGFCCPVPVVDTGRYLPYLAGRLRDAGGVVVSRRLQSLAQLAEVVPGARAVNCSGIGARALAGDDSLRPVRGQVVILANPGITSTTIDWSEGVEPTYAIVHPDTVVAGGCAEVDRWSLDPDPATSASILSRVTAMVPPLAGAPVLGVRVGLRPWRPEVRVELDPAPPPGVARLVHCYGHGGAGVTLSWGSAQAAVALLAA
jgi:D-amino-acid oxidase